MKTTSETSIIVCVLSIVYIVGIFITGYFNPIRQVNYYTDDYKVEMCEQGIYKSEYCKGFDIRKWNYQ